MEIIINGETLDIANQTSIAIEETNPIFNDRGTQSLPLTVPATQRNNRILSFPTRIDVGTNPNNPGKTAMVQDGVYSRTGLVNITEADERNGISFNVGFDNSTAYAQWSTRKLSDLSNLPVYAPNVVAPDRPIDVLLNELYTIYQHPDSLNDDFAIFPVAVNKTALEKDDQTTNYWEILNLTGESGLVQPREVNRIIDGQVTEVSIPEGYMVSPFLRVWRILELIFSDLGMTILSNPFKEVELSRLVVLNNAADSCCLGSIRYSDLMPDCTVSEFLNALWTRFGLVYNLDCYTNTVQLMLIKDIIHSNECRTIDSCISIPGKIIYNERQYIKLSAKTSIEGAAPSHDRFEDFSKGIDISKTKRGYSVGLWTGEHNALTEADSSFLVLEFVTGTWYKLDSLNGKVQEKSSGFFHWDPQPAGYSALELSSEDECVPLARVSNVTTGTGHTFNDVCPLYLFGARHYHSYIKNGETSNESNDSTPLSFMFAYGIGQKTIGRLTPEGSDGKPVKLDDGTIPTVSLLFHYKDGLFNTFWAEYDELLRHGNRSIEISAILNKTDLQRLNVLAPVRVGNIRCLIDKAAYSLPAGKGIKVDLTLRTIQAHGDYDISAEQNVPDFSIGTKHLAWVFLSESYGTHLDTPEVREEAAQLFIDGTEYQPHGTQGDYYFVDATGLFFKSISRDEVIVSDDTFGMALHEGETRTRKFSATITYSVYEIHDMTQEQGAEEDMELSEDPIGEVKIAVDYDVTAIAQWVAD